TVQPFSAAPAGRRSFLWARHCCQALATYPEVERSGPLLLPYLVLLRMGFALPEGSLPPRCALTAPFHPYRRPDLRPTPGGIFSVALSVKSALSEPPRPLAGMLPCGDRTFLSRAGKPASERPPVRQARPNSRRTLSILHPRLIGNPIHLPSFAAVIGERLFKVGCTRGGVGPNKSNKNAFPIQRVLGVKFAPAVLKLSYL